MASKEYHARYYQANKQRWTEQYRPRELKRDYRAKYLRRPDFAEEDRRVQAYMDWFTHRSETGTTPPEPRTPEYIQATAELQQSQIRKYAQTDDCKEALYRNALFHYQLLGAEMPEHEKAYYGVN